MNCKAIDKCWLLALLNGAVVHGSSGFQEASGSSFLVFPSFVLFMPLGLLPALARPAAPNPPYFPACHSILVSPPPWEARVCTQRTAPESQNGSRTPGLGGRRVCPHSALVEEADFLTLQGSVWSEQLDGGQGTGRAAGVGGTSGWHRHLAKAGVLGLEFIGSEGGAREGR